MSNTVLKLASLAMLASCIGVLFWAFALRRGMVPILLVNMLTASLVLAYQAPRLFITIRTGDVPVIALIVFELSTLTLAALALGGTRVFLFASMAAFAVNGLAGLAAAIFAFSFRMTRLF